MPEQAHLKRFMGQGTTSQRSRDRLITRLQQQGIDHPAVLDVMRFTPRHIFIDDALSDHAYDDTALPIGYSQTISQPYIVARMTATLLNKYPQAQTILEIGSGCGYQTAILAQLLPQVYSVERIAGLHQQAQQHLQELGLQRQVKFRHGDGYQGWADYAPYDLILVTAAPAEIPPALLDQLAVGGYLITPVGMAKQSQQLQLVWRTRHGFKYEQLDLVSFVPLCTGIA